MSDVKCQMADVVNDPIASRPVIFLNYVSWILAPLLVFAVLVHDNTDLMCKREYKKNVN